MTGLGVCLLLSVLYPPTVAEPAVAETPSRPNILFLFTDDQRADGFRASGNDLLRTPNLDSIAARGTRFTNAFATLAICSPSRAATLTGRYGSACGVTSVGRVRLNPGEPTFARALAEAGYATGVTGKWHLGTTPEEAGFQFVATCAGNGTWYDRTFSIQGDTREMPGFVEDVIADESVRFMRRSVAAKRPTSCGIAPRSRTWTTATRGRPRRRFSTTIPLTGCRCR